MSKSDFLDDGISNEESGDRWLGSDILKALRFYQKAYDCYTQAISVDPSLDSYYNACRLLFHVYNTYTNYTGIDIGLLFLTELALVIQPLDAIVGAHEQAVATSTNPSLDLLYNLAVAYTEVAEQADDVAVAVEAAKRAMPLLETVMDRQVKLVIKFVGELESTDSQTTPPTTTPVPEASSSSSEQLVSEEVVQPSDVFDTLLSSCKLCLAVTETAVSTGNSAAAVTDILSAFFAGIQTLWAAVEQQMRTFTGPEDMVSSVTSDQQNELAVLTTSVQALQKPWREALDTWTASGLVSPEAAMLAADTCEVFIAHHQLSKTSTDDDAKTYWTLLTTMNSHLKRAQELLQQRLTAKKASPSTARDLGLITAQIADIMITRGDIDLQRSQVQTETAAKSSEVLVRNCKAFLKNAMNTANTPGGLRELALEKHVREYRKIQAVVRLCLHERKNSVQELNAIVGAGRWEREVSELSELWYYRDLVRAIHE